jgi:hypothetical protein
LAELSDALPEALPELADTLPKPLAELADALSELSNRTAGAERLSSGVGEPADGTARGPARLDSLLRGLTYVIERLRQPTTGAERLLAQLADVADCVVDGMDETLQDLRVSVERRQRPIEDVVEILEADFEQRFRFDARDVNLDLAKVDVDAGDDLEEVRQLCTQREMRLELLDVDVNLVDLDLANIDKDVWLVARRAPLELLTAHPARATRARGRALPLALRPGAAATTPRAP